MAENDAFAAGVEDPADDPFAGADLEFQQEDPLADAEAPASTDQPVADVPIVNAEGERIAPEGSPEAVAAEGAEAASQPEPEAEVAPQPEQPVEEEPAAEEEAAALNGDGDPGPVEPAAEELDAGLDAALGAEADPTEGAAPASETQEASPAAEAASAPAAQSSPSPASATPTDDGSGATAADDGAAAAEASAPTDEKDGKGTVTHRPYALFTPEGDGPGLWREVHWYEDKDGNVVKKGTPGAKKQTTALARGQEDALGIGYAALGSPDGGAPLVAVPVSYWKLSHVEPDPVPVQRQRLKIRR